MKTKHIAYILLAAAAVVLATIFFWPKPAKERGTIISSSFIGMDFATAVTGEATAVLPLLPPNADMHDYEPTPQDVITIQKAELFIYIGGESESWVERLLEDNEISSDKTLRLMDFVEPKKEELKEGMEDEEEEGEEDEYDEHIWTSPKNAVRLVNAIRDKLTAMNYADAKTLEINAKRYTDHLEDLDKRFATLVQNAKRKTIIVADRFPFRYFVDEYGLDYYAAFPGCSEQTEPSAATVANLMHRAEETGTTIIFKTESSDGRLARTVAEVTGAQVRVLKSGHNITADDQSSGKRYVDMLEDNYFALSEALN